MEMETETETETETEMELELELRVHVQQQGLWSLATSLELRPNFLYCAGVWERVQLARLLTAPWTGSWKTLNVALCLGPVRLSLL